MTNSSNFLPKAPVWAVKHDPFNMGLKGSEKPYGSTLIHWPNFSFLAPNYIFYQKFSYYFLLFCWKLIKYTFLSCFDIIKVSFYVNLGYNSPFRPGLRIWDQIWANPNLSPGITSLHEVIQFLINITPIAQNDGSCVILKDYKPIYRAWVAWGEPNYI